MTAQIVNLAASSSNPSIDETEHIAESALRTLPRWSLLLATCFITLGIVGVAALDVCSIFNLLQSRFVDILGNPTYSTWVLAISSFLVLVACFLAGELFHSPRWWPRLSGGMMYIVTVAFLAINIRIVYADDISQVWGSSMGAELGGSQITNAGPPMLLAVVVSMVIAVIYSMPGLVCALLFRRAQALWKRWLLRSEALDIMRKVEQIKLLRTQARALRIVANHAKQPDLIDTAAKAAVNQGVAEYCASVQQTMDAHPPNMSDSKLIRDRKKSIVNKASDCLQQAQSLRI